jgi:hypothetical protein
VEAGFVRLLNAEPHGHLCCWLLAEPELVTLHWDQAHGQRGKSTLCAVELYLRLHGEVVPAKACRFCGDGQEGRAQYFAACLAPGPTRDGKRTWDRCIVQLPMALIDRGRGQLIRGMEVQCWNLGSKERPTFGLGRAADPSRIPATFNLLEALQRIKGPRELPAMPPADDGSILPGPWRKMA